MIEFIAKMAAASVLVALLMAGGVGAIMAWAEFCYWIGLADPLGGILFVSPMAAPIVLALAYGIVRGSGWYKPKP